MQDLGKFKGCAYAKFDYNSYKTMGVIARLIKFDRGLSFMRSRS